VRGDWGLEIGVVGTAVPEATVLAAQAAEMLKMIMSIRMRSLFRFIFALVT
jgi:hypothetical protein